MDSVEDSRDTPAPERSAPEHSAPADLAQLMMAARANTVGAMERLLETAQTGELPTQLPTGTGYLLFVCAGEECAVPLSALREVLPSVPRAVYLPFSPEWMLGIFPLRNEMLGLVDPVPLLTRRDTPSSGETSVSRSMPESWPLRDGAGMAAGRTPATALVVGSADRCLAWAVESVGDIAMVQDAELLEVDASDLPNLPFERRYVAHRYTPVGSATPIFVLDAEALLTDLLDALEKGSEGHDA